MSSSSWGALDFSDTLFSNSNILTAMEHAADGIHNGYTGTGTGFTIVYGNSNDDMSKVGMTDSDALNVGYYRVVPSRGACRVSVSSELHQTRCRSWVGHGA